MTDYTTLISTDQLAGLIDDENLVVVDCRSSLTDAEYGRRAYAESHIPGALFASLDEDLASHGDPALGRHPLPDARTFMHFIGALGIGPETQVVTYDDVSGAIAGRLWWMLSKWLGHARVAVLDGGFRAWTGEERVLSDVQPVPAGVAYSAQINDAAWLTTDALVEALNDDAVTIIDARTAERYDGVEEPIDPVAGHIPGAVNMFLGGNLEHGRYSDVDTLRERFAAVVSAAGGAGNIVHSCGSGVSALHNMIAMEHAGFGGSRLYAGSWSEWIRDPARPVGVTPAKVNTD